MEEIVGDLLRRSGFRLSVAESCTGGLLGHRLTNIPGSSDYFLGGVISYANQAKVELLGVSEETLTRHGAVSRQTVEEMANGARDRFGTEVALAISGVAGPGGGTEEKPVGLVWIGLSAPGAEQARKLEFDGSREQIKAQAAEAALQLLYDYLTALSA